VEKDVDMNLDLIQFIRRIRMHGAALTMLLKSGTKNYINMISRKKDIDTIDLSAPKTWNTVESLSYNELISIGALKRFRGIVMENEMDVWFKKKNNP
jgi:hypothetical protein